MPSSTQQRPSSIPKAYAATLLLGVAMSPFIINLQGSLSSFYPSSSFFLRRSLSFNDIDKYSTLQDVNDIDPSIESRAKAEASDDKCSNMFLYLPDAQHFSEHGHGSQINTYIVSVLIGTYLNRKVLLVEPPNDMSTYAGASQFGCPVDAFEAIHMKSPASSSSTASNSWQIKENFPGGLSRLIDHPTWLSGGCPIPCADTYSYDDWVKIATAPTAMSTPISCKESNGRTVNVIATGGGEMRKYFRSKARSNHFIANERWGTKLGATLTEARIFSTLSNNAMFDYAVGLMIKAGFLRLQPWIARDVEMFIKSFDLFQKIGTKNQVYDSIHVRRGDKLIMEARDEVVKYWRSQGHSDEENLPTNYIPFAHYLSQFKKEECLVNQLGEVIRIPRVVYVATDDPVVVKEEIANLPNRIDDRTVLWNDCHELSFYFNPTDESAFHLNGDGETGFSDGTEDTCFNRYHRNIASIADMVILAKSRTFVGEFNSNWGRLMRTMRVRLDLPTLQDDGGNIYIDKKAGGALPKYSKTLDMRIAWGPRTPRLPGQ
uniref:Uncharacterized protein n=1 Tax=Skeletonema marinoi TaxID=267567 RepID=A0A7S2KVQ3_9STRA|mmetsp:Transcript_16820/g.28464  ORF Transcript_16820/g.28464 Transcript_16820/m.28464 type:complete len:545 (+) Transcript_16820:84-1718(+)